MPKNSRAWMVSLVVFLAAFALAFAWQCSFGSYHSEFGGHPDEPGHVVTGLFIRDALVEAWHYAAGGFHGSPIHLGKDFADRYYTHYPKIGLGVWPPFFYLVQSAWTLPFGATRGRSSCCSAGWPPRSLCSSSASCARNLAWCQPAITGGVVLISLPLVRTYYGMVMAETLSAVLMFGAIVAFGNFIDREKRGDAIWFGVLAALAILTKGTGLALALRRAPWRWSSPGASICSSGRRSGWRR